MDSFGQAEILASALPYSVRGVFFTFYLSNQQNFSNQSMVQEANHSIEHGLNNWFGASDYIHR